MYRINLSSLIFSLTYFPDLVIYGPEKFSDLCLLRSLLYCNTDVSQTLMAVWQLFPGLNPCEQSMKWFVYSLQNLLKYPWMILSARTLIPSGRNFPGWPSFGIRASLTGMVYTPCASSFRAGLSDCHQGFHRIALCYSINSNSFLCIKSVEILLSDSSLTWCIKLLNVILDSMPRDFLTDITCFISTTSHLTSIGLSTSSLLYL